MYEYLSEWNEKHNGRVKLQYGYAVLALSSLVVAGLASLINQELGQSILSIAFGLTFIFFANAVGWVLLDAFILQRLRAPQRTIATKKPASSKKK